MKGTIAMFFAPLDEKTLTLFVACLVLMLVDTLVGTSGAFMRNEFKTSTMREGLCHKGTLLVLILLGWICDTVMMHVPEVGLPKLIMFGVCLIVFFMELGSVLENLVKINPELSGNPVLKYFSSKVDGSKPTTDND